jgi:hypothetical protein
MWIAWELGHLNVYEAIFSELMVTREVDAQGGLVADTSEWLGHMIREAGSEGECIVGKSSKACVKPIGMPCSG